MPTDLSNLYYILWDEVYKKFWGINGQRMAWTDTPKLYRQVSHALNAYRASVDALNQGRRPHPESVKLIPVHLTAIGTKEKPRPLSDFYEVVEKEWRSRIPPHEKIVYYSVSRINPQEGRNGQS